MKLSERIAKKLLDGYLTPRGVNELLIKELNEVAQLEACDLCGEKAEYRQCQRCMNDKLVGSHTDEEFTQLEAREASARAIMERFIFKVDSGRARSTETYAEMKEWLDS